MKDLNAARRVAEAYIVNMAGRIGVDLVLLEESTRECQGGWVFFYDSRQYVETGSISHALAGNAPIIVSKRTGEVSVTGTARPVEDYIREFERAEVT